MRGNLSSTPWGSPQGSKHYTSSVRVNVSPKRREWHGAKARGVQSFESYTSGFLGLPYVGARWACVIVITLYVVK
jgi:hypothetical protein